jgi:hypothetical protein
MSSSSSSSSSSPLRFRSIALVLGLILASVLLTVGCARSVSRSRTAAATAAHRATLAEHRALQISRLHAYLENGVFPLNPTATTTPRHMFKDAAGTRCAVANLIFLDGHGALVDKMAMTHNDVVVADEASGSPLHDWVLTSGLTNEEVRAIQGIGFDFIGNGDNYRASFERNRLQDQLRAVEKELLTNTEASLTIATSRLDDNSRTRLAMLDMKKPAMPSM